MDRSTPGVTPLRQRMLEVLGGWINPKGGHLGRQVKVWPDPRIFKEVIIPWLVHTLGAQAEKAALYSGSRVSKCIGSLCQELQAL